MSAAAPLDAVAAWTAGCGLDGLLCCTGIPGTVGGAIVGNAGAWGRQVADVLASVRLMDRAGAERDVGPADLGFGYRRSRLQAGDDIVVSARFRLERAGAESLLAERERILGERAARHPDPSREPCIGSIFRNMEPTSAAGRRQAAGWFLDRAGAKSLRVGGAFVFPRHANIIVKGEGCRSQDVFTLAQMMKAAVKERFDLDLVREVRFLGPFDGAEDSPVDRFF